MKTSHISGRPSAQQSAGTPSVRVTKPKLSQLPRRRLITSIMQATIGMSLGISILSFVITLIQYLPVRQGDFAKHESLQYNTFICVIVPLVLAYCSQSRTIAAIS